MLGEFPWWRICSLVRVDTSGMRGWKDRDHREPTQTQAEEEEGQLGDALRSNIQQATPNHRVEGLAHSVDNISRKVHR